MAHIAADSVKETTTTTGTGAVTLAGAASGYRAFSAVCANNDTFFYTIEGGTEWEHGVGTYVSATPAITRTTVLSSSNAGAAVNFSAGTKDVYISNPAVVAPWGEITVTPSTNQNDYAPSGIGNCTCINLNIGATMKLTGLTGGIPGRRIALINTSTDFLLWLENENTASTAANRFKLPRGMPAFLMPGDYIELRYDSASSRWRVSEWPNQGQAMGLSHFDDISSQSPSSSGQSCGIYSGVFSGTGASITQSTPYLPNSTEKPWGVVAVNTGTTTTGRAAIGMTTAGGVWGQGPMLHVSRLAVEAATNGTDTFTVRSGFVDDVNTGSVTNGAGWEYHWTGAVVEWSTITVATSVVTRANTSMPTADTTYIWLIVFVNAAGSRVDFIWSQDSVSFTAAPSMSTGLPAAGTAVANCGISITKSAGTTTKRATIDLMGHRVDYVRG